jgi:hypothetical protein
MLQFDLKIPIFITHRNWDYIARITIDTCFFTAKAQGRYFN